MNMYKYKKTEKDITLFPVVQNKEIEIDWDLFNTILSYRSHSMSKAQENLASWIMCWVELNIPEAVVTQDKVGNVYITKSNSDLYPCMVAHLDCNQDESRWNVEPVRVKDWLIGIDLESGEQTGLGCDDKNGVIAALLILKKVDNLKVFFAVDEEIGAIGSRDSDKNFFADCTMILQLDRNSFAGPEFCTFTNGIEICSKKFLKKTKHIFNKYGYFESSGSFTDVGVLKSFSIVNCIAANIGCGYFDEHCDNEVTYIPALENAINFAYELIINFGYKKWHHVSPPRQAYSGFGVKYIDAGVRDYSGGYPDYKDWHEGSYLPSPPASKGWINGTDYISDRDLDYETAQRAIDKGDCPACEGENTITEDIDGMCYCCGCQSYYNIPQWHHQEAAGELPW